MIAIKKIASTTILLFFCIQAFAQQNTAKPTLFLHGSNSFRQTDSSFAQPLQQLGLVNVKGTSISVFDAKGRAYFSSPLKAVKLFTVGGALGKQIVRVYNNQHVAVDSVVFYVNAKTNIDDGGYYKQMFN